jgi:formylglycine-generating enzyme required for sulfatase activity
MSALHDSSRAPRTARRVARISTLLALALPLVACSPAPLDDGGQGGGGTAGSGGAQAGAGGSAGASDAGGGAGAVDAGGAVGGGGADGGEARPFSCTSTGAEGTMVSVPAGPFIMGCNEAVDTDCRPDEKPMHEVTLGAFEIDETEVTQDQYAACVVDGGCEAPYCDWDCDAKDLPASCVDWALAKQYCAWADKRLPTEAEWEKAARGTDGQKYPWGNTEPTCLEVNMNGCGNAAEPVGSHPDGASPYGALDMAGNMVEMVSDWYSAGYYASSPSEDPQGPVSGTRYVGRGGGLKSDPVWQRASARDWYDTYDQGNAIGFRCAR